MTPQPMSDAEIEAIREDHISWTGDFYRCESPELAWYTSRILAARDAQWREMLGEPVGEVRDCVWRGMSWSVSILAPTKLDLRTPLYAIKETP